MFIKSQVNTECYVAENLPITTLHAYKGRLVEQIHQVKIRDDWPTLRKLTQDFAGDPRAIQLGNWAEVIVPVPSSLWGRWRGRFDLAYFLAAALARQSKRSLIELPWLFHFKLRKEALVTARARYCSPETTDIGSFEFECAAIPAQSQNGAVRRVLIVDDVVTTGRSLARVQKALFLGAATKLQVRALTLAGNQSIEQ